MPKTNKPDKQTPQYIQSTALSHQENGPELILTNTNYCFACPKSKTPLMVICVYCVLC